MTKTGYVDITGMIWGIMTGEAVRHGDITGMIWGIMTGEAVRHWDNIEKYGEKRIILDEMELN